MEDRRHTPSYGAIVIENTDEGPLVLMCGSRSQLSFPKGHQEIGEEPAATARREVLEETGIDIIVDTSFSRTVASFIPGDERTVTFFLGHSREGVKTPVPQQAEVRRALWVPVGQAPDEIYYAPDRAALADALKYLAETDYE